jgi:hypothetical protein
MKTGAPKVNFPPFLGGVRPNIEYILARSLIDGGWGGGVKLNECDHVIQYTGNMYQMYITKQT